MAITHERRGETKVCTMKIGAERRKFRRHEFDHRGVSVERFEGDRRGGKIFGHLVDISAGGVRIRTPEANVRPDTQIRLRLELPSYAGITPFVTSTSQGLEGRREWVGWMTVRRISKNEDGNYELAGPLEDMEDMDRGMLGLYLSTQPLAA